jgi:hypothetical protein
MYIGKRVIINLMTVGVASFSLLAQAAGPVPRDLLISNNTDYFSTAIINGGPCSTVLPNNYGITSPHEMAHTVPGGYVKMACFLNPFNCTADVYMTENCSGPKIATVYVNIFQGINSVDPVPNSGYSVVHTDNSFTINPA